MKTRTFLLALHCALFVFTAPIYAERMTPLLGAPTETIRSEGRCS